MLSLQCGLSIGDWRLFSWNWRMSAWCSVNSIPILISATNTIKVLRRSTLKKHQLAFKDNVKNLLPIATWYRKLSSTDAAILRSTWKQGRTRKTIMHSSWTSALVSAKIIILVKNAFVCSLWSFVEIAKSLHKRIETLLRHREIVRLRGKIQNGAFHYRIYSAFGDNRQRIRLCGQYQNFIFTFQWWILNMFSGEKFPFSRP